MEEPSGIDADPFQDHLSAVIAPRPEIRVFIAKNEKISIVVNSMREDLEGVDSDVVQIPLNCAEQVGSVLINIAKKYRGL